MQLVQRAELGEEPELFDTIVNKRITAGDIRKLQDAGIDTYSSLLMHTKKNLTGIQGKSEAKVDIISQVVEKIVKIWDGIGESKNERDKMLLELGQECLDIYQRKVEYTRRHKADFYLAALGNRTSVSLEQLSSVKLTLGDLRLKKRLRVEDFSKTEPQITRISAEMAWAEPQVNEDDLTTRRLSERKSHLKELQADKALRLQNIHNRISSIRELSMVRHGQSESISTDTLAKLSGVRKSLKQEKEHSLQKKIWDGIGESNNERDKMLLELEQECLDIYQREVEYTRKHTADLYLAALLSNRTSVSLAHDTLKEQLSPVKLTFGDLRLKKRISAEMAGNDQLLNNAEPQVNEDDLTTTRRLSERKSHLKELQTEKALCLQKVHNHISSMRELSTVMSLDFETTSTGRVKEVARSPENPCFNPADTKLNESCWEVIRKSSIKSRDKNEGNGNDENGDHEENENEDHEEDDDEDHEEDDDEDHENEDEHPKENEGNDAVIEVFVRVTDMDDAAEVWVGHLNRKLCESLDSFEQLEAVVGGLRENNRSLIPLPFQICCQRLVRHETYMDMPNKYSVVIENTDRILVIEPSKLPEIE